MYTTGLPSFHLSCRQPGYNLFLSHGNHIHLSLHTSRVSCKSRTQVSKSVCRCQTKKCSLSSPEKLSSTAPRVGRKGSVKNLSPYLTHLGYWMQLLMLLQTEYILLRSTSCCFRSGALCTLVNVKLLHRERIIADFAANMEQDTFFVFKVVVEYKSELCRSQPFGAPS